MIEGSAAVLASVLASLPADASVGFEPSTPGVGGPIGDDDADDRGPVNTSPPLVDSSNMPWDDRIHSDNKGVKADGTWRRRRNVDDATFAAVEAELRAQGVNPVHGLSESSAGMVSPAAPPAPAAPPPPMPPMPVPTAPMAPPPAPMPAAPVAPPMPVPPAPVAPVAPPPMPAAPMAPPPPAPVAPVAPPPAQTAAPEATAPAGPVQMDFNAFMQHIAGQMAKKDANGNPLVNTDVLAQYTNEIATAFGTPMTAFTDIMSDPNKITYAMQLFQRDGRWN